MNKRLVETLPATRASRVQVEIWEVLMPSSQGMRCASYEVTTSTGYLAVLPACYSDTCESSGGMRRPCSKSRGNDLQHGLSVNAWCEHTRTHCHAWHLPTVLKFAKEVAASYGSAGRRESPLTGLLNVRNPRRPMSVKKWAEDPYAQALEGRS